MKFPGAVLSLGVCLAASSTLAADKVSFGTNWLAEAEHGGYYQAVVDGTDTARRHSISLHSEGATQMMKCAPLAAIRMQIGHRQRRLCGLRRTRAEGNRG